MAKRRISEGSHLVCVRCLENNPRNLSLSHHRCIDKVSHGEQNQARVWILLNEGTLELYPDIEERPTVRPKPIFLNFQGKFKLCYKATRYVVEHCQLGEKCNYAHSVKELEIWNKLKFPTRRQLGPESVHQPSKEIGWPDYEQSFPKLGTVPGGKRRQVMQQDVRHSGHTSDLPTRKAMRKKSICNEELILLRSPLSEHSYKSKLRLLLDLEELAHEEELQTRCDGEYYLHLDNALQSSHFHSSGHRDYFSCFAYLTGLNGDQISYATQASRELTIISKEERGLTVTASILPKNYSHTEEKLYLVIKNRVKFSKIQQGGNGVHVSVKFELKHEYFDRLRDSVARVPSKVVSRIVPDGFPLRMDAIQPFNLEDHKKLLSLELCSDDQIDALRAIPITSCPRGEPPFLVTGPFGSGKTRLLAIAAHISFKSSQKMRLLVCVQQHVSANAFISCFNELSAAKDIYIVQVVTENKVSGNQSNSKYSMTVKQLQDMAGNRIFASKKVMVIATCSTAINLLYKEVFHIGYFSHIYIDEGAQMREPEAVAPLGFATQDTVLVMAGDQHQVGPAMLVLGEKPQECGLSISLVERLGNLYMRERPDISAKCHKTLTTNFRCHPDIIKLSGELFYKVKLTSRVKPHEEAPFPFYFICSDVSNKLRPIESGTIYREEAEALSKEMVQFSIPGKVFPLDGSRPDTSQFAYASPCRSQLSMIEKNIQQYEKLRNVNKVPIYNIQGNEYQALFLSTTEPTYKDGSTRNPTKSICDPFVFNTVISRARLVIVSVGNPFTLLRKEVHMEKKYGDKARCWSKYLKLCLEHGTFLPADSLGPTDEEWKWILVSIRGLLRENYDAVKDTHNKKSDSKNTLFHKDATHGRVEDIAGENEIQLESPNSASSSGVSRVEASIKEKPETLRETEEHKGDMRTAEAKLRPSSDETKFTRDFKIISRLGKGGYGVVYRVKKHFDEGDYAIKIIKLNPQSKHDLKREVKALALLNHSRIVRYYSSWTETLPPNWKTDTLWADLKNSDTYTQRESREEAESEALHMTTLEEQSSPSTNSSSEIIFRDTDEDTFRKMDYTISSDVNRVSVSSVEGQEPRRKPSAAISPISTEPTCLFIQTELCKRGTLRDWLTDHTDNRPREKMLLFTKQILQAVDYIHKKKLIHRDLKPSNILFDKEETDSLKVGDFGLVTPWEQPALLKTTASPRSASKTGGRARQHTAHAGTELYRSPEQRSKQHYNSKVAIFALGLILFELNYPMITGHQMNKVFSHLRERGRQGFPENFARNLPNEARLIGAMVSQNPHERPTARSILDGNELKKIEKDIATNKMPFVPFEN